MMIITGVRLLIKAMKVSSLTALPIMILGGSPIKVAVPPTLDAIICDIKKALDVCAVVL